MIIFSVKSNTGRIIFGYLIDRASKKMTSFTNSPKTGANSDIINWLDIHSVIDLLPWGERGRKYISRELCDLFHILYLLFVATVCLDIITSSAPYRQIYHLPLDSYSFFNTSRGYIWKFYRPIIIINNLVVCPNHSVYEPSLQGAHLLARLLAGAQINPQRVNRLTWDGPIWCCGK